MCHRYGVGREVRRGAERGEARLKNAIWADYLFWGSEAVCLWEGVEGLSTSASRASARNAADRRFASITNTRLWHHDLAPEGAEARNAEGAGGGPGGWVRSPGGQGWTCGL
jgi:hypothetical protein